MEVTVGKADSDPNTSWQLADVAVDPWFDSNRTFHELPEEIQAQLNQGLMPLLWDRSSPRQRRKIRREWHDQHHPALAQAHEAVWEKMDALNDCERTASRIALEDR